MERGKQEDGDSVSATFKSSNICCLVRKRICRYKIVRTLIMYHIWSQCPLETDLRTFCVLKNRSSCLIAVHSTRKKMILWYRQWLQNHRGGRDNNRESLKVKVNKSKGSGGRKWMTDTFRNGIRGRGKLEKLREVETKN